MKLIIFYTLLLSATISFLASCKKFVEIQPGPGLINTKSIFLTEKTALSAISGVYTQMRANLSLFSNGALSLYPGLAADELYATAATSTTDPFYLNELLATNTTVNAAFYTPAYKIIYQTNSILEGVARSNTLSDSTKSQFTGEMKVVRAMIYFYLTNLFGDLPLIITTDYKLNASFPRISSNLIYNQIIADLTDAQKLLQPYYPSQGKVRPNKWTALALLSRVYLYRKDWKNAEQCATSVINSRTYELSAALNSVFLKNSPETIWEIASSNEAAATGEGNYFIPSSPTIKPFYSLTTFLFNSFEPGDQRKLSTNWVGKSTISGQDYYYPFKYKVKLVPSGGSSTEHNVVLRLAEQYLIRAEARAQENLISTAQEDLNKIRLRASISPTNANDKEGLLLAIEAERRSEFFSEWGHRWFDLKRNEKINEVLGVIKGTNWQNSDALFPIPQPELNYNPFLLQNPGY